MQARLNPPVLFYGVFLPFHSYNLKKLKKNSDNAGGKLNQFNQFNGTITRSRGPPWVHSNNTIVLIPALGCIILPYTWTSPASPASPASPHVYKVKKNLGAGASLQVYSSLYIYHNNNVLHIVCWEMKVRSWENHSLASCSHWSWLNQETLQ